jgi:hypothetical protein
VAQVIGEDREATCRSVVVILSDVDLDDLLGQFLVGTSLVEASSEAGAAQAGR